MNNVWFLMCAIMWITACVAECVDRSRDRVYYFTFALIGNVGLGIFYLMLKG